MMMMMMYLCRFTGTGNEKIINFVVSYTISILAMENQGARPAILPGVSHEEENLPAYASRDLLNFDRKVVDHPPNACELLSGLNYGIRALRTDGRLNGRATIITGDNGEN